MKSGPVSFTGNQGIMAFVGRDRRVSGYFKTTTSVLLTRQHRELGFGILLITIASDAHVGIGRWTLASATSQHWRAYGSDTVRALKTTTYEKYW